MSWYERTNPEDLDTETGQKVYEFYTNMLRPITEYTEDDPKYVKDDEKQLLVLRGHVTRDALFHVADVITDVLLIITWSNVPGPYFGTLVGILIFSTVYNSLIVYAGNYTDNWPPAVEWDVGENFFFVNKLNEAFPPIVNVLCGLLNMCPLQFMYYAWYRMTTYDLRFFKTLMMCRSIEALMEAAPSSALQIHIFMGRLMNVVDITNTFPPWSPSQFILETTTITLGVISSTMLLFKLNIVVCRTDPTVSAIEKLGWWEFKIPCTMFLLLERHRTLSFSLLYFYTAHVSSGIFIGVFLAAIFIEMVGDCAAFWVPLEGEDFETAEAVVFSIADLIPGIVGASLDDVSGVFFKDTRMGLRRPRIAILNTVCQQIRSLIIGVLSLTVWRRPGSIFGKNVPDGRGAFVLSLLCIIFPVVSFLIVVVYQFAPRDIELRAVHKLMLSGDLEMELTEQIEAADKKGDDVDEDDGYAPRKRVG